MQRREGGESEKMEGLSLEQKRDLYRDGYVILKQIVPRELTAAARECLAKAERADAIVKGGGTAAERPTLTGAPELTDLLNKSPLTPLIHDTMGYFDPPRRCQV